MMAVSFFKLDKLVQRCDEQLQRVVEQCERVLLFGRMIGSPPGKHAKI